MAILKDTKEKGEKTLVKEVRRVNMTYLAVSYFEERMKKRRAILLENMDKSQNKTYSRRVYSWKTADDAIIQSDCNHS